MQTHECNFIINQSKTIYSFTLKVTPLYFHWEMATVEIKRSCFPQVTSNIWK